MQFDPMPVVQRALSQRKWRFLAVDINGSCHFSCFFCEGNAYYKERALLSESKQEELFRLLGDLGKSYGTVISLAGLEPLASKEVASRIPKLTRLLANKQVVGLITAGQNLEAFADIVTDNIDFLNVSIDGPPEIHDQVRGKGAFQKAHAGISEVIRCGFPPEKIIPSSVACQKTWGKLPGLWQMLADDFRLSRFATNLVEAGTPESWDALLNTTDVLDFLDVSIRSGFNISVGVSPRSIPRCGEFWTAVSEKFGGLKRMFTYDALGFPMLRLNEKVSLRLVYSHLIYKKIGKVDATGEILVRHEDLTAAPPLPIGNLLTLGFSGVGAAMGDSNAPLVRHLRQGFKSLCCGNEWFPLCMGSGIGCHPHSNDASA